MCFVILLIKFVMKRLFSALVIISAAFIFCSCSNESITPEELLKDSSKVAVTTMVPVNNGIPGGDVITFNLRDAAAYRNSDYEGKSWFFVRSEGKMVYDAFMISIFFDSIDKLKTGDKLNISQFRFSFVYSSDSRASTESYKGNITLAAKGDDYVILHFNKVRCSCSFGDCTTDGYIYCPLL